MDLAAWSACFCCNAPSCCVLLRFNPCCQHRPPPPLRRLVMLKLFSLGRSPTKRQNAGDDLASLHALFWDALPFASNFRITTPYPRKIVKSTPVEFVECRLTVGYTP